MNLYKIHVSVIILCCIASMAFAAGTTAGTIIKNQASATYKDTSGNAMTSTSNEVITTVQARYSFVVTPDGTVETPGQTQVATVGNTVYFPYRLLNSSNTAETFTMKSLILDASSTFTPTNQKIYRDVNGNGVVDTGDTEIPADGTFGPVGIDDYFYFIVAYDVPTNANVGQVAILTPSVDSVNDGSAYVDNDNYNKTTVVSGPVVTANITATPTTVKPGDTVAYTISGSNTGTSDAKSVTGISVGGISSDGILVNNQLPPNVTYKAGGYSVSGPTNSIIVWSTDNGVTWVTSEPTASSVTNVGLFMPDAIPGNNTSENVLVPSQAYQIQYNVTVNANAPAGIIQDSAKVDWRDNTTNKTTTTNNVDVEVVIATAASVVAGPKSDPTSTELKEGENLISKAPAGGVVIFYDAVRNTGNSNDTFDLTFNKDDFPAGSVVQFYDLDGITPLSDSDNDGKPDTGVVASGADRQFVVKVFLPGTATNDNSPHDLIVTATSSNDPTKSDTVVNELTTITRPMLDIGNRNPTVGQVDDTSKNFPITPNSYIDIPLDILNKGEAPDTFTLSTAGLPAGYVVTYYIDANGDGILDPSELTPVSSVNLPAYSGSGAYPEMNVIARVTAPANATPVIAPVDFVITSNLDPSVSDKITNNIIVNPIYQVAFEPDRNGTGIPGGSVTYTHIITNTGNANDTYNLTYTSPNNWTYVFYDTNGNIINNVALNAGESKTINIKAFIPSNAAVNTVDSMIATATSTTSGSTFDTVTDNTVVIAGVLQLSKKVANITQGGTSGTSNQGKPGDILEYTINYKNISTVAVNTLIVADAVPQYTEFVSIAGYLGNPNASPTGPAGQSIIAEWSANGADYTNFATTLPSPASVVKFIRWKFTVDGTNYYSIPAGFDSDPAKTLSFRVKIK